MNSLQGTTQSRHYLSANMECVLEQRYAAAVEFTKVEFTLAVKLTLSYCVSGHLRTGPGGMMSFFTRLSGHVTSRRHASWQQLTTIRANLMTHNRQTL